MKNWDQYKDLSLECSPLTHVSKDDPPVFLNYGKPAPIPVIKGDGIHHAGFGRLLKEKCQAVGIPCYLQVKDHEVPPINKDNFIKKVFSIAKNNFKLVYKTFKYPEILHFSQTRNY